MTPATAPRPVDTGAASPSPSRVRHEIDKLNKQLGPRIDPNKARPASVPGVRRVVTPHRVDAPELLAAKQAIENLENGFSHRGDYLNSITWHEIQLMFLRKNLPSALKTFYHFRCNPQQHVFVYAANREQAEQRLHQKMDRSYGEGWSIAVPAVKEYTDAAEAALACSDNLLRTIGGSEALEFIADYQEDRTGKTVDLDRPANRPSNSLENDVESYKRRLRRQGVSI